MYILIFLNFYICFNLSSKLAMEMTYSRIIYSCLIFGSRILCDRKLERRQAVSSCSVNTEDNFYCSNGLCIKLSWACDGREDCPDGSDETKELCGQYEYGTNMTMDCGRVKNQAISVEPKDKATIETAPWYVSIFKLQKEVSETFYLYWCGGTLIAPNVVISVASVFRDEGVISNQISINDGRYKITVGKYDRNFTVINNNFTQIIDVEMIYKPNGYNAAKTSYYNDNIAVIILANKVSFGYGIVPVCIDWKSKYNVQEGNQGKAYHWEKEGEYCSTEPNNTNSFVLLEKSWEYYSINDCSEFYVTAITNDSFCAGSKLGPNICQNKNGGQGLSFLHTNSYFLTGVESRYSSENNYTAYAFTDIKYHVQWIREILIKHFTINSCVLPIVDGVIYSYEGSNDILSHGKLIDRHLTVIENCELGYHKAYSNAFRYCLGNGKWLSNSDKLCFKMCPPLESDSLDIECSYNGEYANCSNLSTPGTIVTPSCKATYIAPNGQEYTTLESRCQSNGMWDKQLYRCNPYCGRTYVKSEVLIAYGEKSLVGTAPWNVGVYRLNQQNSNHEMICGGSVIAPNLVISAAHCFWNVQMSSKLISIKDGLYKVAVGKYDRNFKIIDNEFTQIISVETIHVNEGYYGSPGFYASDISMIVLPNKISFSNGVAPICIDWKGKYNVANGDKGKVVGWGKTEKDLPSPILLEASLPYINHSSCRKMFTGGFEPFVTVDKFCAGSEAVLGQGVGQGDSGAGLCFFHHDSYYLTGVVSVKDPSSINNSIAVFTEIKYHIQWIRELYLRYN